MGTLPAGGGPDNLGLAGRPFLSWMVRRRHRARACGGEGQASSGVPPAPSRDEARAHRTRP